MKRCHCSIMCWCVCVCVCVNIFPLHPSVPGYEPSHNVCAGVHTFSFHRPSTMRTLSVHVAADLHQDWMIPARTTTNGPIRWLEKRPTAKGHTHWGRRRTGGLAASSWVSNPPHTHTKTHNPHRTHIKVHRDTWCRPT